MFLSYLLYPDCYQVPSCSQNSPVVSFLQADLPVQGRTSLSLIVGEPQHLVHCRSQGLTLTAINSKTF